MLCEEGSLDRRGFLFLGKADVKSGDTKSINEGGSMLDDGGEKLIWHLISFSLFLIVALA